MITPSNAKCHTKTICFKRCTEYVLNENIAATFPCYPTVDWLFNRTVYVHFKRAHFIQFAAMAHFGFILKDLFRVYKGTMTRQLHSRALVLRW